MRIVDVDLVAVTVDWQADAAGATPPPSRMGNYLRSRENEILGAWREDGIVGFAHHVVRVAQPPAMTPGPIRPTHPAVMGVGVEIGEDGNAVGTVHLACLPAVSNRPPAGHRTWHRRWDDRLEEPDGYVGDDRQTVLVASARLSGPISLAAVAHLIPDAGGLLDAARRTIDTVVDELNTLARPVLSGLVLP